MIEPGAVLGGYQILAQIGSGAAGIVYRAEHKLLGHQVAIKVLRPELAQRPDIGQRFLAEARAITGLAHPNIVTIQHFAEDDTKAPPVFYMVMELLQGQSLDERVRQTGPLDLDEAFAIATQAASALGAVHATNRVHRDLKSDNIFLVSGNGVTVKLLDFGLVRALNQRPSPEASESGTAVGALAYMAPELVLEGQPIDRRADLYALGVVLYEMLVGHVPFVSASYGQLMIQLVKDRPRPLSEQRTDIPKAVEALVLRCLEKKAGNRFQTVEDLQDAIMALRCTRCGKIHGGTCPVADSMSGESEPPDRPAPAKPSARPWPLPEPEAATMTIDAELEEEASILPPGATIGAYKVLATIGQGGMGRVYLALHESLQRKVAIKMLREAYAAQADAVQRVFREALAASRINHPNIVAITDFVQDKGTACYVMEYLEGESLIVKLLRLGKLPLDEALAIAEQTAAGLEALHQAGVIHRDLKPGNIFLVQQEGLPVQVKLLDFGLAQLSDEVTTGNAQLNAAAPNPTLATPAYCSPEQIRSPHAIDRRTDIYSFGVVLYAMLVGKRPHETSSDVNLLANLCVKVPPSPSERGVGLPRQLETLIMDCLSIDPGDRPSTAADVLAELRAIIRERATAAARLRSRSRLRWELLALGFVVLLAGAFVLWQYRFRPAASPPVAVRRKADQPIAALRTVSGQVQHRPRDTVAFGRAAQGMKLFHLDALKTGARSQAVVAFVSGGTMSVSEWTTVLIEASDSARKMPVARLKKGTVSVQVQPGRSLRVISPDGRESVVEAQGDKPVRLRVRQRGTGLELAVLRGKAHITSAGRGVDVGSGKFVDVGQQPMAPAELPPFPELVSPDVDALVGANVVLRWRPVARAKTFRVQLGRSYDFRDSLIDRRLGKNELPVESLAAGRYIWRVCSIDEGGREGEFGFSRRFVVLATPSLLTDKAFVPLPNAVYSVLKQTAVVAFRWPRSLKNHTLVVTRGRADRVVVRRPARGGGVHVRLAPGAHHWRLAGPDGKLVFPPRPLTMKRRRPPVVIPSVRWQKRKGP